MLFPARMLFLACGLSGQQKTVKSLFFSLIFALPSVFVSQLWAQDQPGQITGVSFERAPRVLVLEHEQVIPLLGSGVSRRVQFFGDGTVEIDLARPHASAGNHVLTVGSEVVDSLVSDVLNANLIQTETASESIPPGPTLFAISDPTFTRITLRINSFMSQAGDTVLVGGPIVIAAENVAEMAFVGNRSGSEMPENLSLLQNVETVITDLVESL